MLAKWIGFPGLRSPAVSLLLIGIVTTSAAHAEPVYLPTAMGTERFGRSAVNSSALSLMRYAETERRQTFCGPTALAIAMNSLGINDPTPPRYFPYHLATQEAVFTPANEAIKSFAQAEKSGVTLDELGKFAANLKLSASVIHASDLSAADMRDRLVAAIGRSDSRVIVNFFRGTLGQVGEGHFSPLVAYDLASDSFLILDVARYKYPPGWVSFKDLNTSMRTVDEHTGLSRGALIVARPP